MVGSFTVFLVFLAAPVDATRLLGRLRSSRLQAAQWRDCAMEDEALPEAGRTRFGFGFSWVEANLPRGATCSVSAFGQDPSPGIQKMCQCAGDAVTSDTDDSKNEMGALWKRCAKEGQACSCPSGKIRFGHGTRWISTELGELAPGAKQPVCGGALFDQEDPDAGFVKECWCRDVSQPETPAAKVAIVLLSRRPPDAENWLKYHLDFMGISHIFMSIEDTPDFNRTFSSMSQEHQNRVTIWHPNVENVQDKRPKDDYETLQKRQMTVMSNAHSESLRMGIDWLIHTDDDELLYTPTHRTVGDVLANMPQGFDEAFIPNVEAVFPSAEVKSCFTETTEMNTDIYSFVSYANGKAAMRVSNRQLHPAGPHQWRDQLGMLPNSIHLDQEPFGTPLMVVHYESCPFNRWESKYWELGNTSPEKIQNIPFQFYKESIKRMQRCTSADREKDGAALQDAGQECSEPALKELWSSFKTLANPRIHQKDLVPIRIPWARIMAKSL